jgi:hypothetical protein
MSQVNLHESASTQFQEVMLNRQRDGKVIRWKVEQGPVALARIILSGAEK